MKRLFSPWRSAYIQTFKDTKKSGECLFCRIAQEKKDEKNLVVWRGKHCYGVMNLFPYNSGHLLIVPYRHTAHFGKLTSETSAEIMHISARCMKVLEKISKPQGFNFGANLGRAAGAGIEKHVHFHIVPRWNGDTNLMPVLADVKMISEDLKKTWADLRKVINRSRVIHNKWALKRKIR